jgi:hypothetical protein
MLGDDEMKTYECHGPKSFFSLLIHVAALVGCLTAVTGIYFGNAGWAYFE